MTTSRDGHSSRGRAGARSRDGTIVASGARMGVVLLLVALPASAALALSLSVFDPAPAIGFATMVCGAIGGLVHAAREWDA